MALIEGVNTYAIVTAADIYFDLRLNSDNWTDASNTDKEKALAVSTRMIETLVELPGEAVGDLRAMPRHAEYHEPILGKRLKMNPTPVRFIEAFFELAYHIISYSDAGVDDGSVNELEISGIKLKGIKGVPDAPSRVYALLLPLQDRPGGGFHWWRSN